MLSKNIREFNKKKPIIHKDVFVDPSAVVTGDVELQDDASIWPHVSIRGDLLKIKIGKGSNIQDGSVLHTTHISEHNPKGAALTIGDEVTVGHHVTLHGCTIGNRCLIGMNSCIMDEVIIEDNVFIAAGSLVTPGKILKSGYLYQGSPAKQIRELTIDEISFFTYSAKHYILLKNQHISELSIDN